MAKIEGFRVKNYKALKDIEIGRLVSSKDAPPALTPLTVVLGKNGVGKSSLFDAFGFVADCLATDVETACDLKQRGGFGRLRSKGVNEPIYFEIHFRQSDNERPINYSLEIDIDRHGRPYVLRETLKQRRDKQRYGRPFPFLKLENGKGLVWAGEDALAETEAAEESNISVPIEFTDNRRLGIGTLGVLKEHPRIQAFRDFLAGWYLSYFYPDAARTIQPSGPQRRLNIHGDNIGNVVQFMQRDHPERFKRILEKIASKIPGIYSIYAHVSDEDKRVFLRFNDGAFKDPFYSQQMSDGTLKIFAYLLLMEDPEPPPFICIEEPENGLYHKLLDVLADEFRAHATGKKNAPQIFVTTHQPYLVDALRPEEVWILAKGQDGFSTIKNAASIELVKNLVDEGLPLGSLWYSDYLDAR
jgi:predicted ATPase